MTTRTKFTVEIRTDNAAFHPVPDDEDVYRPEREVARILRRLADRIEDGMPGYDEPPVGSLLLLDVNGATVGTAEFVEYLA